MNSSFDNPSASELLEAVREFLLGTVVNETTGATSFHARVAANALAIVERELALGDRAGHEYQALLTALGAPDEAVLAAQIRAGEHDTELEAFALRLLPFAEVAVDVTNPRWRQLPG